MVVKQFNQADIQKLRRGSGWEQLTNTGNHKHCSTVCKALQRGHTPFEINTIRSHKVVFPDRVKDENPEASFTKLVKGVQIFTSTWLRNWKRNALVNIKNESDIFYRFNKWNEL